MTAEFIRGRVLANWPNSKLSREAAQVWESELDRLGVEQPDFEQAIRDLAWSGKTLKVGVTFPEVLQAIRRLTGIGGEAGGGEPESPEVCVFGVCIRAKNQEAWYRLDLEDGYANRSGGVYWAGDWSAARSRPLEDRRMEGFRFAQAVASQMQGMGFERSQVRQVCPGFERFLSDCLDMSLDEIWPYLGDVQQAMSFEPDRDPFDEDGEGRLAKSAVLSRISGMLDSELLKVAERRRGAA